jgi:amidohydrolase
MNMSGSDPKLTVRELLEEAHPALVGLSHWIHANPELGFEETLASGWVAEWLTTAGFEVTTGAADMPTAVIGSTGPGPLHVVICAEYDALPAVGHACGHNVIAASGVGAGIALASVAEQLGLRVTVMGTPAEESGGGKLKLIEAGSFEGVHAALMVHPWTSDVVAPSLIAARTLEITYTGKEAHAAGFPHLGVNAADALVIAQAAIGLLRQHLLPTDRVHGIVTKGGDVVNVVPAHTTAQFMVRATTRERLDQLTGLVRRCFEAGAIATGSELSVVEQVAYSDMRHDSELSGIYRRNAEALGRVFDETPSMPVSTDMGDVSYVVPSIHPMIGIEAGGAVNHQAAFAEACASESADRAVLEGAVALAWTVIDAAADDAVRSRLLSTARTAEPATLPEATSEALVVEELLTERELVEELVAEAAVADADDIASVLVAVSPEPTDWPATPEPVAVASPEDETIADDDVQPAGDQTGMAEPASRRDAWAQAVGTPEAHDVWRLAFDDAVATASVVPAAVDQASVADDGTRAATQHAAGTNGSSDDAWGYPEAWAVSNGFAEDWLEGAPQVLDTDPEERPTELPHAELPHTELPHAEPVSSISSTDSDSLPDFEWISPESGFGEQPAAASTAPEPTFGKHRKH